MLDRLLLQTLNILPIQFGVKTGEVLYSKLLRHLPYEVNPEYEVKLD